MLNNLYRSLSDKELSQIIDDALQSKEKCVRAESLVPYARQVYENLNSNTNNPTVTLKECLDITYLDFMQEVMRRFVKNNAELEQFRERETAKEVISSNWMPDKCPSCGHELSESLGDGYYTHPTLLERCPECLQKIKWDNWND